MKRTKYRKEQNIGVLTEHEAGAKCADLFRKHEISDETFDIRKTKLEVVREI